MDDFKIHILNYFIKSLNESIYLKSHKLHFTIIGDGERFYKKPANQNSSFIIEHFKKVDLSDFSGYQKSHLFGNVCFSFFNFEKDE